jgi:hypothetical protein
VCTLTASLGLPATNHEQTDGKDKTHDKEHYAPVLPLHLFVGIPAMHSTSLGSFAEKRETRT